MRARRLLYFEGKEVHKVVERGVANSMYYIFNSSFEFFAQYISLSSGIQITCAIIHTCTSFLS